MKHKVFFSLLAGLWMTACGNSGSQSDGPVAPPVVNAPGTNPSNPSQPQKNAAQNAANKDVAPSIPDGEYKEVGYGGEGMESPILFKKVKHDFGNVRKGAVVKAEYFYKNTSTHSVEFENAFVSCECMKAEFKKDPIHPNETGSIKVTFDTKDMAPAGYEKIVSLKHKGSYTVQALLLKGKVE